MTEVLPPIAKEELQRLEDTLQKEIQTINSQFSAEEKTLKIDLDWQTRRMDIGLERLGAEQDSQQARIRGFLQMQSHTEDRMWLLKHTDRVVHSAEGPEFFDDCDRPARPSYWDKMNALSDFIQEANCWGVDPSSYNKELERLTAQQEAKCRIVDSEITRLRVSEQERRTWQVMYEYDSSGAWKSQTSAEMQAKLIALGIVPTTHRARWAELDSQLEREISGVDTGVQSLESRLRAAHFETDPMKNYLLGGVLGGLLGYAIYGLYIVTSGIYGDANLCGVAIVSGVILGAVLVGTVQPIEVLTLQQQLDVARTNAPQTKENLKTQYEKAKKSVILDAARQITREYAARDAKVAELFAAKEGIPVDTLAAKKAAILHRIGETISTYADRKRELTRLLQERKWLGTQYQKDIEETRATHNKEKDGLMQRYKTERETVIKKWQTPLLELRLSQAQAEPLEVGVMFKCDLTATNIGWAPAINLELVLDGIEDSIGGGTRVNMGDLQIREVRTSTMALLPRRAGAIRCVITYSYSDTSGQRHEKVPWGHCWFNINKRAMPQSLEISGYGHKIQVGGIGNVMVVDSVATAPIVTGKVAIEMGNSLNAHKLASRAQLCETERDYEQAKTLYRHASESCGAAQKELPPSAAQELQQLRSQVEYYAGKIKTLEGLRSQRFVIPGEDYVLAIVEPGAHIPNTLRPETLVAARSCVEGKPNLEDGLQSIFGWVRNNISYGANRPVGVGYRDAVEADKTHEGVCGEQAFVYMAMARSVGARCNFMLVDVDCHGKKVDHACVRMLSPREFSSDTAYKMFDVQKEAGSDHRHFRIVPDGELFSKFGQWRGTLN